MEGRPGGCTVGAGARTDYEQILAEEVEAALGAGRGRRVAERCGYRHGRKPRRLALCSGVVELAVPRTYELGANAQMSALPHYPVHP